MVGGSKTSAHSFKVREEMFKRDQRNNLFTQRLVGIWNTLPEGVVEAGTITTYTRHMVR